MTDFLKKPEQIYTEEKIVEISQEKKSIHSYTPSQQFINKYIPKRKPKKIGFFEMIYQNITNDAAMYNKERNRYDLLIENIKAGLITILIIIPLFIAILKSNAMSEHYNIGQSSSIHDNYLNKFIDFILNLFK